MLRIAAIALLALCAQVASAATLYVTEIRSAPPSVVIYQAAKFPDLAEQHITIGAGSTQSAAFNEFTGLIRVSTDATCHVVIGGTNPTATVTSSVRLVAGSTEYFVVAAGDKLAVIAE